MSNRREVSKHKYVSEKKSPVVLISYCPYAKLYVNLFIHLQTGVKGIYQNNHGATEVSRFRYNLLSECT